MKPLKLLGFIFLLCPLMANSSNQSGLIGFDASNKTSSTKDFLYAHLMEQKYAKGFFAGLASGFLWANVLSDMRTGEELFCTPPHLIVNDSLIYEVTTDFVGKNPDYLDKPIGFAALSALKEKYRCNKP